MKENKVKEFNPFSNEVEENFENAEKKEYLSQNPFLYNPMNSPYVIDNIEEYRVKYKKDFVPLKNLLRNATFSKRKKLKIANKAFDNWEKDLQEFQEVNIAKELGAINSQNHSAVKKISFKTIILISVLVLILLVIMGLTSGYLMEFINVTFFRRISQALIAMFEEKVWMRHITNIVFYTSIISFIFIRLYNIWVNDYLKENLYVKNSIEKNIKKLDKEYYRRLNKTKKYYITNIKSKNYAFAPYSMMQICDSKVTKEDVNNMTKSVIENTNRFKRNKVYFLIMKYILLTISIVGTIFIFGYSVYEVIIRLIS